VEEFVERVETNWIGRHPRPRRKSTFVSYPFVVVLWAT